jgi:hypothetical protein
MVVRGLEELAYRGLGSNRESQTLEPRLLASGAATEPGNRLVSTLLPTNIFAAVWGATLDIVPLSAFVVICRKMAL